MKPGQATTFEVIPAVDILGGKCVRLEQGNYNKVTVYYDDPVVAVLRWIKAGASRIHLVDLDGAKNGVPGNQAIIKRILQSRASTSESNVKFQVGGGIRTVETVKAYLDAGADRAIIGSQALAKSSFVEKVCQMFGARIAVSLDARGLTAAAEGWLKSSGKSVESLIPVLVKVGVSRFIYTDIERDGMLSGPNFASIQKVAKLSLVPIIASGGVSSDSDVQALRKLFNDGVEGCIVGKAIYEGKVTFG